MSPMYEYTCTECKVVFDKLTSYEDKEVECPKCSCIAVRGISAHGGYSIKGDNSASIRPKKAGSMGK